MSLFTQVQGIKKPAEPGSPTCALKRVSKTNLFNYHYTPHPIAVNGKNAHQKNWRKASRRGE
jgi:hypothetical protein